MNYYVDLILPVPLNQTFTYEINKSEYDFIQTGVRIAVPFGKSRIITGIVDKIYCNNDIIHLVKPIYQIIDQYPLVSKMNISFWHWISNYYLSPIGDVMKASVPSVLLFKSESVISLVNENYNSSNKSKLTDDEYLICEALHVKDKLSIDDIYNILSKKNIFKIVKALNEKRLINIDEELYSKYKVKTNRFVSLNNIYLREDDFLRLRILLKRSVKQLKLVNFFINQDLNFKILVNSLKKDHGYSSSVIKTLIDKNILLEHHVEVDRYKFNINKHKQINSLSNDQELSFKKIISYFNTNLPVLFYGITSSGKTEVYIKIISNFLKNNNQILYLVPEIALTTQIVSRLRLVFGDKVLVYHSGFSINQRVEVWKKISKNDQPQLIIGARSSLMLPFTNLKLIIVDEEHEQSYKQQEPSPRYNARDSSVVLAKMNDANILLGSATPSLESYTNAIKENKYALVELKTRFNNILLPEVKLVDLKLKYSKKLMNGHFSDTLIDEIFNVVSNQNQVILYQNRRGYSPVLECEDCGTSPKCINCDVSLTYHLRNNILVCHYCGYTNSQTNSCHSCNSVKITSVGFGTEQVEEEIKNLFPNYRVSRLDYDTTRKKNSFENIISDFENQKIDILIGTQMISKGLDFKNVQLVGILNADNSLNFPDFRAYERSFQSIQQVAGRAGRSIQRGKVIIQTFNPKHKILENIINDDYASMYDQEMKERVKYNYPPNCRLIKITLKHKDYNLINESSLWLSNYLKNILKKNVLGPEFPYVMRIRNKFQKNILIKIQKNQSMSAVKQIINKSKNSLISISSYRSIRVVVNIDCY
jgi:primosomal protein N' (replication factor Y)